MADALGSVAGFLDCDSDILEEHERASKDPVKGDGGNGEPDVVLCVCWYVNPEEP